MNIRIIIALGDSSNGVFVAYNGFTEIIEFSSKIFDEKTNLNDLKNLSNKKIDEIINLYFKENKNDNN